MMITTVRMLDHCQRHRVGAKDGKNFPKDALDAARL